MGDKLNVEEARKFLEISMSVTARREEKEGVKCGRCKTINPTGLKRCRLCGAKLRRP